MKRIYTKPILAVELFQIATEVAASCSSEGAIVIYKSEKECEFDAAGQVYFVKDNKECSWDVVNPNEFGDKVCYHGYNNEYHQPFIAS